MFIDISVQTCFFCYTFYFLFFIIKKVSMSLSSMYMYTLFSFPPLLDDFCLCYFLIKV